MARNDLLELVFHIFLEGLRNWISKGPRPVRDSGRSTRPRISETGLRIPLSQMRGPAQCKKTWCWVVGLVKFAWASHGSGTNARPGGHETENLVKNNIWTSKKALRPNLIRNGSKRPSRASFPNAFGRASKLDFQGTRARA